MVERPGLTVTAAVEAFDVERRTLQRLLTTGKIDGAFKNERGHWVVPVEALHGAGFAARQTWFSVATHNATQDLSVATMSRQEAKEPQEIKDVQRDTVATELRQYVANLEAQLDTEKRLREAAERNAEDLRGAMRMLEAGQPQKEQLEQLAVPVKRRWWHRS